VNMKRILSTLSLFIVVLSAACQTGDSSGTLPTVAVLPTSEATTEATTEATQPATPSTPGVFPTQTPLFSAPSAEENATLNAQLVPGFTPQATTDIAGLSGTLDLTSVAMGDTISLVGTLTIEETSVVVTDSNGSRVIIDMPIAMSELLVGKEVYIVGIVASTDGDVTLQLLTIQELVPLPTVGDLVLPSDMTAESTVQALPTMAVDVRLGANLTALATYDQLIGQIGGTQLGDRQWSSISGNPTGGWSFSFYSETDNSVIIYNVLTDGSLQNQIGIPPLDGAEVIPLSRDTITIDSDRLLELYVENGGDEDLNTVVLLLQATDADTIHWSVLSIEGLTVFTVDAVSGEVVQ
jgi:hypothetical protein